MAANLKLDLIFKPFWPAAVDKSGCDWMTATPGNAPLVPPVALVVLLCGAQCEPLRPYAVRTSCASSTISAPLSLKNGCTPVPQQLLLTMNSIAAPLCLYSTAAAAPSTYLYSTVAVVLPVCDKLHSAAFTAE